MEVAGNTAVSFGFLPCPADFEKNVILQCTFGERLGKTRMTQIFFVSRSCRFVLIGGYIFKTGATKIHETTLSTARVLSDLASDEREWRKSTFHCRRLKAAAMKKAGYERMRRSESREHLFDCQRPQIRLYRIVLPLYHRCQGLRAEKALLRGNAFSVRLGLQVLNSGSLLRL